MKKINYFIFKDLKLKIEKSKMWKNTTDFVREAVNQKVDNYIDLRKRYNLWKNSLSQERFLKTSVVLNKETLSFEEDDYDTQIVSVYVWHYGRLNGLIDND